MGDFAQIKLSNTTMYAFLKNVTMYVLILRRFRNKLLIKTIHSKSGKKKIFVLGYTMNAPKGTPEACSNLMMNCWEYSPSDRKSFQIIKKELKVIHGKY